MSWTRPELNLLRQNEAQSSKNWPIRAQRENFAKSVSSFFASFHFSSSPSFFISFVSRRKKFGTNFSFPVGCLQRRTREYFFHL